MCVQQPAISQNANLKSHSSSVYRTTASTATLDNQNSVRTQLSTVMMCHKSSSVNASGVGAIGWEMVYLQQ